MKKIITTVGLLIVLGVGFLINNTDVLDDITGSNQTEDVQTSEEDKALLDIKYDKSKHPENYVKLNGGKTELSDEDKALVDEKGTKAWQQYTNLDSLGRSQKGTAMVTNKVVTQHSSSYMKQHGLLYGDEKIYKRPPFPSYVHVSGEYADGHFDNAKQTWKGQDSNNGQTDLGTYNGWLYNKSHTIGWALGGDMETHNVTLGTRAQNVGTGQDGGMGYIEGKTREAVQNNKDAQIFYEATPVYKDNELVPRGTHVRAYSVNDNGKTLNENVWVFNTQDGVNIDYATGQWK